MYDSLHEKSRLEPATIFCQGGIVRTWHEKPDIGFYGFSGRWMVLKDIGLGVSLDLAGFFSKIWIQD